MNLCIIPASHAAVLERLGSQTALERCLAKLGDVRELHQVVVAATAELAPRVRALSLATATVVEVDIEVDPEANCALPQYLYDWQDSDLEFVATGTDCFVLNPLFPFLSRETVTRAIYSWLNKTTTSVMAALPGCWSAPQHRVVCLGSPLTNAFLGVKGSVLKTWTMPSELSLGLVCQHIPLAPVERINIAEGLTLAHALMFTGDHN